MNGLGIQLPHDYQRVSFPTHFHNLFSNTSEYVKDTWTAKQWWNEWNDSRSVRNLSNCIFLAKKKNFKARTGIEPMTSNILSSHICLSHIHFVFCSTCGTFGTHNWPAPNVSRLHSSVGRATHRYRGGPVIGVNFFQAKRMQLPKFLTHCDNHLIHFSTSNNLHTWLERRTARIKHLTSTRLETWASGYRNRWIK